MCGATFRISVACRKGATMSSVTVYAILLFQGAVAASVLGWTLLGVAVVGLQDQERDPDGNPTGFILTAGFIGILFAGLGIFSLFEGIRIMFGGS